jgi:hypothetical protein
MKPSQTISPRINKFLLVFACMLSVSAGVLASGLTISEKLLQAFKEHFPNAEQVKWAEEPGKYMVDFKNAGIATRVVYNRDEDWVSSTRYYDEKNLPANIARKLHKKYPAMQVFGVIETTTELNLEYMIKLEDATSWVTVKSDGSGDMHVVEKLGKSN